MDADATIPDQVAVKEVEEGGDQAEIETKVEKAENGGSADVVEAVVTEQEAAAAVEPSEAMEAVADVVHEAKDGEVVPDVKEPIETAPAPTDSNGEATDAVIDAKEEDGNICKPCNLIFGEDAHLQTHEQTEYHKRVGKGIKPTTGKYYCFLCWRGYGHKLDLLDHYGGSAHEYHVRTHHVKAVWIKLSEEEAAAEIAADPKRRKDAERLRGSDQDRHDSRDRRQRQHRSDRSRSPLRDSGRRPSRNSVKDYVSRSERAQLGRGLRHCVECNLVFVSERSETLHRESQRHRAVFEKKRPNAPSGKETPFVCYLCWWGYDEEKELHLHYESTEHVERMKRYGIDRLLKDTRLGPGGGRNSDSPPACLDGFIILDEVGEEDDEEVAPPKEEVKEDTSAQEPMDTADANVQDSAVVAKDSDQVAVNSEDKEESAAAATPDAAIEQPASESESAKLPEVDAAIEQPASEPESAKLPEIDAAPDAAKEEPIGESVENSVSEEEAGTEAIAALE